MIVVVVEIAAFVVASIADLSASIVADASLTFDVRVIAAEEVKVVVEGVAERLQEYQVMITSVLWVEKDLMSGTEAVLGLVLYLLKK